MPDAGSGGHSQRLALRVQSLVPGGADRSPLILVHGAANSAQVWTFWQAELARRGWASHALDLRGHGGSEPAGVENARMADYADDVTAVARTLRQRPILLGWSMGGLVAMMAAAACDARAWVGLAPSTPARARDTSVALRSGAFGPEEYGIVDRDPDHQAAMPDLDRTERMVALESLGLESRLARDERTAGIVVERIGCPLLIVTGTADLQWPRRRYDDLCFPADHIAIEGVSHWGLVLNRRALTAIISSVIGWLEDSGVCGGA
jgi:pimeloyl-ACP methyl ester carboxylesterase